MASSVLLAGAVCSRGTDEPAANLSAELRLANVPDGVGRLHRDAGGAVRLEVDAFGFAPDTAFTGALRPGRCLDEREEAMATFAGFESGADGTVKATVDGDADLDDDLPDVTRVDVYAEDGETPVLCTDLRDGGAAAFRLYPNPGEKPFGNATVTYSNPPRRLTATVSLNALRREGQHRVEIGEGTCREMGRTRYRLGEVEADMNRRAETELSASSPGRLDPAQPLYLVVRAGPDGDDRPILCGAVDWGQGPNGATDDPEATGSE